MQALVWDYSPVVPISGATDQIFYKQELPPTDKGQLTLDIANVPNGKYHVATYQIGYKHNDRFTAYVQMGLPWQLSPSQAEALKNVSSGESVSQSEISIVDGHFTKTMPFRTNDCFLVVLTPTRSEH